MVASTPKSAACTVCNQSFPSRTKLFHHLKESGHGDLDKSDDYKGVDGGVGEDAGDVTHQSPSVIKGNDAYYAYYLRQNICNRIGGSISGDVTTGEDAWKHAYDKLRTPLPVSYRIQESSWMGRDFCADFLDLIETTRDSESVQHWGFNADDVDVYESIGTLPKIQMTIIPRKHKSSTSNEKSKLHSSILHGLQELGAIQRQELVSAIPTLVLWSANSSRKTTDGKESKNLPVTVADMCAAPGSKSLQLLDLLHMNSEERNRSNDVQIPSGLLVVNDSDRTQIMT